MPAKYSDIGQAKGERRKSRQTYPFVRPPELGSSRIAHYPVVIAGGGPIGLATAAFLSKAGIQSVVLEKHDSVSDGSRAICWAKRTLEILDRLGIGDRILDKGVTWNTGKVYFRDSRDPLYEFDLLPDKEQRFPAFINLQQYYVEEYMLELLADQEHSEVRWQQELVALESGESEVVVTVNTPDGPYQLTCDYLIAADGHRSPIRAMMGLDFEGRVFEDNFLIADVRMKADFPAVRRFWFDPPFNRGQTALMHKQADDVWRIDFQLGWDIDRDTVLEKKNVDAKIRAFLGPDVDFDYEWVSLYTFHCRRMEQFVHDRVIFVGDSAHLVSPFGARGANGGLQDVDNLVWKLDLLMRDLAPADILQSYDKERIYGADENILNSTRSTDFISPKSEVSKAFRDAALELARDYPFARSIVNPGRLSVPCVLDESGLTTADEDEFTDTMRPGSPCKDAPLSIGGEQAWLLEQLGERFVGLYFSDSATPIPDAARELEVGGIPVDTVTVAAPGQADSEMLDKSGNAHSHYDARPGTYYLIRPDQHVAGRWRQFDASRVADALARATCQTT